MTFSYMCMTGKMTQVRAYYFAAKYIYMQQMMQIKKIKRPKSKYKLSLV